MDPRLFSHSAATRQGARVIGTRVVVVPCRVVVVPCAGSISSTAVIVAGAHHISSPGGEGFGITLYGYAPATSYLLPGGLNFLR